jgi:hypothetical protein
MTDNVNTVGTQTPNGTTTTSTLSDWAGPYVTNMLGEAQGVAHSPYAMYGGNMTAGASGLQQQAFNGIAGLTLPGSTTNYDSMTMSSGLPGTTQNNPWGVGSIQSYMNPYVQNVVDNQTNELRRQSDINRINTNARLTNQGAYGGSRQAIEEAENNRNLLHSVGDVTGKGYLDAFTNAQNQQYRTAQLGLQAQEDTDKSRQFDAGLGLDQGKFGLAALQEQAHMGDTQRQIQQQGLDADYAEFQRQRDYPKQQLQFEQSMLQGLPIDTRVNTPNGGTFAQNLAGGLGSLADIMDILGLG